MKNYLFFIILCFSTSKLQPILCSKVRGFRKKQAFGWHQALQFFYDCEVKFEIQLKVVLADFSDVLFKEVIQNMELQIN
jgi:hypothetical protein